MLFRVGQAVLDVDVVPIRKQSLVVLAQAAPHEQRQSVLVNAEPFLAVAANAQLREDNRGDGVVHLRVAQLLQQGSRKSFVVDQQ